MTWAAGQRVTATGLNQSSPELIQEVFIGSVTASVTINIPTGYNRVAVNWWARMDDAVAAEQLYLRLNADSGAHYLWQVNQANNLTVAATDSGGTMTFMQIGTVAAASATANYFSGGNFVIDGVADGTYFKTAVGSGTAFTSTSNSYCGTYSGQWLNAALVTSFTLSGQTGNFIAGSRITAYGLQ